MSKNDDLIYLDAPYLGELEKRYLARAIDDGFVSTVGPYVRRFEEKVASFLNSPKAVSLQSGTAALHVSLLVGGIGPGDEVIVPALTFIASVNPIMYVGARPVFVDVDPKTWTIDSDKIEASITEKTKAIIPVHLYGNPCDMKAIKKIARKHDLFVIEDATESLGAAFDNNFTGTIGDLGCFSFNGNKMITTGGGGMIVGNDINRLNRISCLVNQGRDVANDSLFVEVGFNYRMTNIEAALGLAQMEQINDFLKKRQSFHNVYREQLEKCDEIRFQETCNMASSNYWMTCALFAETVNVLSVQEALRIQGVVTRRIFKPILEHQPYQLLHHENCPVANYIYAHGLCLPSSCLNSESDIVRVCSILKKVIPDACITIC